MTKLSEFTEYCAKNNLPDTLPVYALWERWKEAEEKLYNLGCQCPACHIMHASDCAVHNMPAYPNGKCTCQHSA